MNPFDLVYFSIVYFAQKFTCLSFPTYQALYVSLYIYILKDTVSVHDVLNLLLMCLLERYANARLFVLRGGKMGDNMVSVNGFGWWKTIRPVEVSQSHQPNYNLLWKQDLVYRPWINTYLHYNKNKSIWICRLLASVKMMIYDCIDTQTHNLYLSSPWKKREIEHL